MCAVRPSRARTVRANLVRTELARISLHGRFCGVTDSAMWADSAIRYGNDSATTSAGKFGAPTDTAMYCLPLMLYVIGFQPGLAGSCNSCTTAPVALSYA